MEKKQENLNLIASCGLHCKDCHGYTGIIPDMARDLRKELRQIHYDKFAHFISRYSFGKDFASYDDCYKVLGAMVKFRCRKGCKNGGGSPFCNIRKYATKKELDGCWECNDFENCKNLEFLEPVHGDAHIKNLKKIKINGKDVFDSGSSLWYSKKKS
jgi:hypothetical protein